MWADLEFARFGQFPEEISEKHEPDSLALSSITTPYMKFYCFNLVKLLYRNGEY